MTYQSINPNSGKLLKKFEDLSEAQLETKLAAADACFQIWKHKTYADRAIIVNKAAALMHAHFNAFDTRRSFLRTIDSAQLGTASSADQARRFKARAEAVHQRGHGCRRSRRDGNRP